MLPERRAASSQVGRTNTVETSTDMAGSGNMLSLLTWNPSILQCTLFSVTLKTGGDMKTVIFLNRWNILFHLMLAKVDGENSRRLDSRYATSLEQARKAVGYWRIEFHVAAEDVHDNSMVDLDDIFSWMDVDLSDELESKPW